MNITECEEEMHKYAEIIDKIKSNVTESYDIYNVSDNFEKHDKNTLHLETTRDINIKLHQKLKKNKQSIVYHTIKIYKFSKIKVLLLRVLQIILVSVFFCVVIFYKGNLLNNL